MVPQIKKLFNFMENSNGKRKYVNAKKIRNYIINVTQVVLG